MQLVNCSHQMLHTSETTFATMPATIQPPSESTTASKRVAVILRWLPGVLLVAAIITSALIGTPPKPRDEVDWLSRLAHSGDAGAQLQLGLAYRDGRYGLTADAKTGLYWLNQSAAGGNAYAEDAIGNAYAKGQGTAQDTKLAEQWWRKAIKDGDRDARLNLADALLQAGQTQEANQLLL